MHVPGKLTGQRILPSVDKLALKTNWGPWRAPRDTLVSPSRCQVKVLRFLTLRSSAVRSTSSECTSYIMRPADVASVLACLHYSCLAVRKRRRIVHLYKAAHKSKIECPMSVHCGRFAGADGFTVSFAGWREV